MLVSSWKAGVASMLAYEYSAHEHTRCKTQKSGKKSPFYRYEGYRVCRKISTRYLEVVDVYDNGKPLQWRYRPHIVVQVSRDEPRAIIRD